MTIWAIIPVKRLHESKQRLAHLLSAVERAALIGTLLQQLLMTLNQVREIEHILVISQDDQVLAIGRQSGALIIAERGQGLNRAVAQAIQVATLNQAKAALILPADLPFVRPEDVQMMVAGFVSAQNGRVTPEPVMAICSDKMGAGTNALLLSLPTRFNFQYGVDSFRKHLEEAQRLGLAAQIVHADRLQFDLDDEEDWRLFRTRNRC